MLLKTAENKNNGLPSGIVLFAKPEGITSFSSLFSIKHALNTSKVGHTGTLDSFACGLLVVCTGALTRLASRITEFDKTYEALILFGKETDTLDPEGKTVRTGICPDRLLFENTLAHFTGSIMQSPPAYSAVHVNGRRASDLARNGQAAEIPARPVTVYESRILSEKLTADGRVEQAEVFFRVSKGTYIRCLARDIAAECGSAAYLGGLKRTGVGSFALKDAAGFAMMQDPSSEIYEKTVQDEVRTKIRPMSQQLAQECGFRTAVLADAFLESFYNGRQLGPEMFEQAVKDGQTAVFTLSGCFAGVIEKTSGKLGYGFVVPRL